MIIDQKTKGIIFTATLLLMTSCFLYVGTTETEGANDDHNSLSQRSFINNQDVKVKPNDLLILQKSIDQLIQSQQQLIAQNESFRQRVEQLENNVTRPLRQRSHLKDKSVEINDEDGISLAALIEKEEREAEEQQEKFTQNFEQLWDENAYQEEDAAWAKEMETGLSELGQQLQSLDLKSTITSQTCGSTSCTIEFTHQDISEEQRQQFFNEIVVPGATQVMFNQVKEGGVDKTLAIFIR